MSDQINRMCGCGMLGDGEVCPRPDGSPLCSDPAVVMGARTMTCTESTPRPSACCSQPRSLATMEAPMRRLDVLRRSAQGAAPGRCVPIDRDVLLGLLDRVAALEEFHAASEAYHYDLDASEEQDLAAWERLRRARKAVDRSAKPDATAEVAVVEGLTGRVRGIVDNLERMLLNIRDHCYQRSRLHCSACALSLGGAIEFAEEIRELLPVAPEVSAPSREGRDRGERWLVEDLSRGSEWVVESIDEAEKYATHPDCAYRVTLMTPAPLAVGGSGASARTHSEVPTDA